MQSICGRIKMSMILKHTQTTHGGWRLETGEGTGGKEVGGGEMGMMEGGE